jgi:hypothetical protein
MNGIEQTANGTTIITGEGISTYQALVVKQGLKAIKVGLRLNRSYTPKNLMAMATKITGQKFKARDYDSAIEALESWIEERKAA